MRKHTLWITAAVFVTGLSFGALDNVFADDQATAGVVRISDGGSKTIQHVSHLHGQGRGLFGLGHRMFGPGHGLFSHGIPHTQQILYRNSTNSCGCSQCVNHSHHGDIGHYLYMDRGPLRNMILPDSSRTYAAGHGWARPTPHPIERNPVEYQRYWPTKWYGQPGGGVSANAQRYPSVYMPTDTTQLGYYYQAVPQWRPNPGMIPPAPWPPNWHSRECPADGSHQVMIGLIGDRWHIGPLLTPHHTTISPTPEEDHTVPPTPSNDEKSASNFELETITLD
jgi:hypothetical protein